ncbi:PIG-L family deacetylase [Longispora albida]|uniref:PIG-L family deacetylase n=1 Tax=Longispora albida TaxID=203523 RepID=UPI000368F46C|nr:PIG-L family deacetylase [Longispora albida]
MFSKRTKLAAVATACAVVLSGQSTASAATPSNDMFMNVVAHEDDDLLFMNPDISSTLTAGYDTLTVFMTAGQLTGVGSSQEQKARNRQRGIMNAYAAMTGLEDGDLDTQNEWIGDAWSVGGRKVERYALSARTGVQVIFVGLRDGLLDDLYNGATHNTVNTEGGLVGYEQAYTKAVALDVLAGIMNAYKPSVIRALDNHPEDARYATDDHGDHVASAHFTDNADDRYTGLHVRVNYRTYNIKYSVHNLTATEAAKKKAIFDAYAGPGDKHDTFVPDTNWLHTMQYRWSRGTAWAGRNADGRPQAFVVRNGKVDTHYVTMDGQWATATLADPGGLIAPGLAVGTNKDGRLEIIARRLSDDHLISLPQIAVNGAWRTYWADMGSPNAGSSTASQVGTPTVVSNEDGRMQVFVQNGGGGVSTIYQNSPNSGWSSWVDLGGTAVLDGLSAVRGPGGRIEVFGSTPAKILHWYQSSPNGGFVRNENLPSVRPASAPQATLNSDGRTQIAYREEATGNMVTAFQTVAGGTWSTNVVDIGGHGGVGQPASVLASGRIFYFERNRGTGVSMTKQSSANGGFTSWTDIKGTVLDYPAAVTAYDGQAFVFTIGTDARVYARWQQSPGADVPFGPWTPLS